VYKIFKLLKLKKEKARALTPYAASINHCRRCTPAPEDELKGSPKHTRQKKINKLKTCALSWSFYNFIPKYTTTKLKCCVFIMNYGLNISAF
jgi:hypothetical protein